MRKPNRGGCDHGAESKHPDRRRRGDRPGIPRELARGGRIRGEGRGERSPGAGASSGEGVEPGHGRPENARHGRDRADGRDPEGQARDDRDHHDRLRDGGHRSAGDEERGVRLHREALQPGRPFHDDPEDHRAPETAEGEHLPPEGAQETVPSPRLGEQEPQDDRDLRPRQDRSQEQLDRARAGGKRDREGASVPGHPHGEPAEGRALRDGLVRLPHGEPAGERAVRV